MSESLPKVRVAVVQAGSIPFDRQKSIEKACRLIREAGGQGAELVLLPEAFVPAYPRGLSFGAVVGSRSLEGRKLWQRYWENSVEVPGASIDLLAAAARDANALVAVGIVERDSTFSRGTLYCTTVYLAPDGAYLGKHRKLKPTGSERLIWGEGDGSTLPVFETEIGRVGGLICWENYMPLVRTALYAKGVEIYLAPTADARDSWIATMRHIACEGRCFVLGCNQYVTKDMYPADLEMIDELDSQPDEMCRGGSVIISPLGEIVAGPLFGKEGILYADLDMAEVVQARYDFDPVGHYARPDVLQLLVNEEPALPVVHKGSAGKPIPAPAKEPRKENEAVVESNGSKSPTKVPNR